MRIPKKHKQVIKEHMEADTLGWTIYSIAKLIGLATPHYLLDRMNEKERLMMVERGRVTASDCYKGLWDD